MKKIKIIMFLAFAALMLNCKPPKVVSTKWMKDVEINGIGFSKARYLLDRETGDTLKLRGFLKENMVIQGYPCEANYVNFSPDWRLISFKLNKDFRIKGVALPKGTWVNLRDDSTMMCMFQEDIIIQKIHPCKGTRTENGAKGIHTSFYENGNLSGYFAYEDVVIDGVPCEASLLRPVNLHKNGKLKSCKLAEDFEVDGKVFSKGTVVRFDEEGHILTSF